MDDRLLNIDELAAYLGIPKTNIYVMTRKKQIPFIRVTGRLIRFKASEIESWLESRKEGLHGEQGS